MSVHDDEQLVATLIGSQLRVSEGTTPTEEASAAAAAAATTPDASDSAEMQIFKAAKAGDLALVKQLMTKGQHKFMVNMAIMGGSECTTGQKGRICQWAMEEGACFLLSFNSHVPAAVRGAMKPGNAKMLGGPGERPRSTAHA
jgi:hypothetical protein